MAASKTSVYPNQIDVLGTLTLGALPTTIFALMHVKELLLLLLSFFFEKKLRRRVGVIFFGLLIA